MQALWTALILAPRQPISASRMQMRAYWSVPKDPASGHENADAMACSCASGVFALSDGASQSYDARNWARLVSSKFAEHPHLSAQWLNDIISDYSNAVDRSELSWSGQASYDRGSFTTLLGIVLDNDARFVRITAVGDSVAVLVSNGKIVSTFPYSTAAEFAERPFLISTWNNLNADLFSEGQRNIHCAWPLPDGPEVTLFGMTDAMGAWLLTSPEERVQRLCALPDERQFSSLVSEEREAGHLKADDTSLLVIR